MKARVLVTGATGFVGSRLVNRLVELGHEVHAIKRSTSNLWRLNHLLDAIKLHDLDLEKHSQIENIVGKVKPQIVFNLACYGGFAEEQQVERIWTINTIATFYLLESCNKNGVNKFIQIGSSSEYGNKTHPLSEHDLERPNSLYGVTKLAASNLARIFSSKNNMQTAILRIFSPYGKNDDQRRLIPMAIKACLSQQALMLGSGRQVRDFVYVEDLVDAFILSMEKNIKSGEIINLGFGKQHTIKDVVTIITDMCGNSPKLKWGALEDRSNEPRIWQSSNEKAYELLNWQPQTSLQEGLYNTIEWMKLNLQRY